LRFRFLAASALLAAACAAPPPPAPPAVAAELFAVLPGPEGRVGSIVVTREGQSRVIDTAYGAQRIDAKGAVAPSTLTRDEVSAAFGPTLEALPGKPASFVLYFLEGKDELTPDSKTELEKVFVELRRRPLPDIVVIGHTDTVGNTAFNDKLSLARAERMRETLVGLGIAGDRIQAAGRGKRELLVPTDENIAEPRNRRVEINVR
jgi:outer membrane protein OmpA-like peptidoglycan-associated protein